MSLELLKSYPPLPFLQPTASSEPGNVDSFPRPYLLHVRLQPELLSWPEVQHLRHPVAPGGRAR